MTDKKRTELQQFWTAQIQKAKTDAERWHKAGDRTVKAYRAEQNHTESRFNILWANTEILKPAVLSRVSRPNITRRFKNEDKVAKDTAETLEKVCAFIHDESEFADELKLARDDMLLPGRGTVRFKYKANMTKRTMERIEFEGAEVFAIDGQPRTPDGFENEDDLDSAFIEDIATEEIIPEYIYWKNFLTSNSRNWDETWWVAYRHGMGKDELEALTSKEQVAKIKLPQLTETASDGSKREVFEVWEIWDKRNRERIWFTEGAGDTIDIDKGDDVPLDLKNFFPCPKPLVPFATTDTMTPIPLYNVYRDQAVELNDVTARLKRLTAMLKFAGAYDSAQEDKVIDLSKLIDGQFIPIQTAADFRSAGGFEGAMFQIPITDIAEVIDKLTARSAALKAEIFELTGIADIMRGHTDPSEGVGTQRIKTVFGTLRLRPLREPMEDFIRESYEIISEIAADKFEPQTFEAYTGAAPSQEVMQLMRSDNLRQFKVNVETDSTVIPNEEIDKRNATEFLTAIGSFLTAMLPIVQQVPQLAPMAAEMLKFGARSFKAGRAIEDIISESIDQLAAQAQQPQQQQEQEPPDPRVQAAQITQQTVLSKAQIEAQSKSEAAQMSAQIEFIKLEVTRQIAADKNAADIRKNELDVLAGGQGPVQ